MLGAGPSPSWAGDSKLPLLPEEGTLTQKATWNLHVGTLASPTKGPLRALSRVTSKEAATRTVERSQHVSAAPEQGETLRGTSLKVITSGLGAGILAAPWGAAGASLTVSALITAGVLVLNVWTTMIIVHAIDRWGGSKVWDPAERRFVGMPRRPGYRIDDLGQLLRQAPHPLPLLATVWDLTVNVSNFGALVGYMIVTGDALTPLMTESLPGLASRHFWIFAGSIVCLPLCWADVAFLTYSSAVGVTANVFLFMVLLRALQIGGESDGVCALGATSGALTCASNIIFSVIVQMCIPEYYTQLRRDDQEPGKFFTWVLLPSFGFIFLLMCSFASVGYLAFGPSVQSNVLKDLPPGMSAKCTQFAMVVACLMVYPNMLRPMVQPLLRGKEFVCSLWRHDEINTPVISPVYRERIASTGIQKFSANDAVECGINVELAPDIYEGRLVHTETSGPLRVNYETGEVILEVVNTSGFVKDDLVFIDGPTREYAVVKQVDKIPELPGPPGAAEKHGCLWLRCRHSEHSLDRELQPRPALSQLELQPGTKVVLDQDPALLVAAVAGERCIQVTFFVGIMRGAGIVIGEGARAERHRVVGTKVFQPARASAEAHLRTHDLVLYLDRGLRHNHGARTRVVLDHGGVEGMATVIVVCVMLTAFMVQDLGVVNALNGAISVAVIMGVVPGISAYYLSKHWDFGGECGREAMTVSNAPVGANRSTSHRFGEAKRPQPMSIRHRWLSLLLPAIGVIFGFAAAFFTDNRSQELTAACVVSV